MVDALRGVAALAVCWFHLTGSAGPVVGTVRASGEYGWLGVEIFFVISGFVIPFALWRSGYAVRDFWRFVAKRVARVDPPYFAAILVGLGVAWAAAHVPGSAAVFEPPSATRLLLHAGYAVPFVAGYEWFNPVFWTLAIEFQYYLVVGLAFPLLAHARERVALLSATGLLASGFLLPDKQFFPAYAPLFVLGIYAFRFRARLTGPRVLVTALCAAFLCCAVTRGLAESLAGAASVVVILAWNRPVPRIGLWLGRMSYSLYLLHWPVGITATAVGRRLLHLERESLAGDLVSRLIGLAAALATAHIFARLVERPALRVAGRIHYGERAEAPVLTRAA